MMFLAPSGTFVNFDRLPIFPLDKGFPPLQGGGSDTEIHCPMLKNDRTKGGRNFFHGYGWLPMWLKPCFPLRDRKPDGFPLKTCFQTCPLCFEGQRDSLFLFLTGILSDSKIFSFVPKANAWIEPNFFC